MNIQMSEFISPKQLEEWIGLSVVQQERIRRHIGYKKKSKNQIRYPITESLVQVLDTSEAKL